MDDREYHTYIWSRPLGIWQATPTILARGTILDDREYEIMVQRVNNDGPDRLPLGERDLVRQLVAEYEREIRAHAQCRRGSRLTLSLVLGVRAALERRKKQLAVVAELVAESDLARVIAGDRHRLDGGEESTNPRDLRAAIGREPA